MDEGRPITTFLVTALILWAVYLWKQNRLGRPGLLATAAERPAPAKGKMHGPPPPYGWRPGTPPIRPPYAGGADTWSP